MAYLNVLNLININYNGTTCFTGFYWVEPFTMERQNYRAFPYNILERIDKNVNSLKTASKGQIESILPQFA